MCCYKTTARDTEGVAVATVDSESEWDTLAGKIRRLVLDVSMSMSMYICMFVSSCTFTARLLV